MKVWVLGAGTLLPHPHRGSPGYWIEAGKARILMDVGSGALRTLARLGRAWQGVTHVILSHFHTDHVADLAPLLFALRHAPGPPRSLPLGILGPRGLTAHLEALAEAHGAFIRDPGFPQRVTELEAGEVWTSGGGVFRLRTFPARHTESALAYRLETAQGTLGYTGDTGFVKGLGEFFAGAQLLVSECSRPDGDGMENHLTPKELAALARKAAPELLVSVHAYPPLEPQYVPHILREEGYDGRALAGRDGMEILVSPHGAEVRSPGFPE